MASNGAFNPDEFNGKCMCGDNKCIKSPHTEARNTYPKPWKTYIDAQGKKAQPSEPNVINRRLKALKEAAGTDFGNFMAPYMAYLEANRVGVAPAPVAPAAPAPAPAPVAPAASAPADCLFARLSEDFAKLTSQERLKLDKVLQNGKEGCSTLGYLLSRNGEVGKLKRQVSLLEKQCADLAQLLKESRQACKVVEQIAPPPSSDAASVDA